MNPPRLTRRQRDILNGLADGLQLVQIAEKLHVGGSTLKVHVRKLYDALGVHTAAGAVDRGHRLGLLDPHRAPGSPAAMLTNAELLAELGRRCFGPLVITWELDKEST